MTSQCPYSKSLGEPGKGLHSIRLFDIAIIDVALTFVLAYMVRKFILLQVNFCTILIGCFILGIILHRLYCVRTTVDKILFP